MEKGKLTATGHHQEEERHSPGQQIQAASLISKDLPTRLLSQTCEQARCVAQDSC